MMRATSYKANPAVRTLKGRVRKPGQKQPKINLRVEAEGCDYELFLRHLRAESNSPQMTVILRGLCDEWLDTGLHANGEEYPFERNPNQTPNAAQICQDFLAKNPWMTMLGSGFHRVSLPTASADTVLSILISGELAAPEKWREYAVETFIGFLGTSRCLHFAKCRGCGQYFDLKRKPKKVYSGGWHCTGCQKEIAASRAASATMKARTVLQFERYELAAHAWAKWKEDSAEPDSSWILTQATFDSPHTVKRLGLKANWITLHREEIQKMASFFRESAGHTKGQDAKGPIRNRDRKAVSAPIRSKRGAVRARTST
jgi:hypothetical protein